MMHLPLTLPVSNHMPRQIRFTRRLDWSPQSDDFTRVRVLEIEILSFAEEKAVLDWLRRAMVRP